MSDQRGLSAKGPERNQAPDIEWRIVCPSGRVQNEAFTHDDGELHRSIVRYRDISDHCCGPRRDNEVTVRHLLQRRTVTYSAWEDQPPPPEATRAAPGPRGTASTATKETP